MVEINHLASCIRGHNVFVTATKCHMAQIVQGMRKFLKRVRDHCDPNPRGPLAMSFLGTQGSVALLVGLAAPTLMMALAVSVELTGWTVAQIQLQRTADVAAAAGGLAYASGASVQLSATHAAYVAEINGASGSTTRNWASATNILTDNQITVAKISGIKNALDVAFQVTISQTIPRTFSRFVLHGTNQTLTATAISEVASNTVTSATGPYCVLAMASTGVGVDLSNGITINTAACGVQDNSAGAQALSVVGGAKLTATSVSVVGSYYNANGGSVVNGSGQTLNPTTGATAGTNPYAGVAIPTPGSCSGTNYFSSGSISPGTFCSGLSIQGINSATTTITMNPGVYIVNGGDFSIQNATVNASGVTIVLTGTSATTGTAQISNGSVLNITAPTSGATSGLAFFQNSNASDTSTSNFMGGSVMSITGAIDFPNSIVWFSNGTNNAASCTQLIAYQIVFQGGAKFGDNCTGAGTAGIGAPSTTTYSVSLVQ
jgi:hypothetical protein